MCHPAPRHDRTGRVQDAETRRMGVPVQAHRRGTDLLALFRGLCRRLWLFRVAALLAPRAILVACARLLADVRPLVRACSTICQGISPPFGTFLFSERHCGQQGRRGVFASLSAREMLRPANDNLHYLLPQGSLKYARSSVSSDMRHNTLTRGGASRVLRAVLELDA